MFFLFCCFCLGVLLRLFFSFGGVFARTYFFLFGGEGAFGLSLIIMFSLLFVF